ncbi:MAG: hypothetical protein KUG69_12425 [Marinosulfonomonas sp.]|nr:hypothetical protein [Marinosulfonomonas sp.]
MSDFTVTRKRIHAGIWEGIVESSVNDGEARIEVTHLEQPIRSTSLTKDDTPGQWQLRIAIPPELLSDGVQVFLINDKETGEKLDSFTIVTGEALENDIRSEVELLRAELDMLKRAFRRHCLDVS